MMGPSHRTPITSISVLVFYLFHAVDVGTIMSVSHSPFTANIVENKSSRPAKIPL